MSENDKGFWPYYESTSNLSPGVEITRLPVSEVADFVRSMEVVHQAVKKESPDIVFVPDRGAQPLYWTLCAFTERDQIRGNGDPLLFCPLPIGTVTSSTTGRQYGHSYTQKREIVSQAILRITDGAPSDFSIHHVVLLDEAQSGSTSSTAVRLLKEVLGDEVRITYIPCKDEGRGKKIRKADTNYKSMAAGEWPNVEGHSIPVPLFYIDRPIFLDVLLDPDTGDTSKNPLMLMTLHNTLAKETFVNITRIGLHKEIAGKLVNPDLPISDDIKPLYENEIFWINSLLQMYPNTNVSAEDAVSNTLRRNEIIAWFKKYARQFLQ